MKGHFTGVIKGNKFIWDNPNARNVYFNLMDGKRMEVSIDVLRNKRSLNQNNYLYGIVYRIISEATGYTVEELNDIYESMFLSKNIEFSGKIISVRGESKHLNTKEFMEFTDKVKQDAAQTLGLYIPDPDENYIV